MFKKPKKVLYLYDYENWAIHNVGKLWLWDLPTFQIDFKNFTEINRKDFSGYDFVWFGYLDLYLNFSKYFQNYDLQKSILTIHDPMELFPSIENWKSAKTSFHGRQKLNLLKKAKYVVSISKEMNSILKKYGVDSCLIPTTSLLPPVDKDTITTKKCDILSVFEVYPRKRMELMKFLRECCRDKLNIDFNLKIGKSILSIENYIGLLDKHEIYICTSFQEGGPLPAMDAMSRGCVVITTPVGQIQEIIEDGKNGFICRTMEEFIDRISLLSHNLDLLHQMRISSIDSISKKRDKNTIKQNVFTFLRNLN